MPHLHDDDRGDEECLRRAAEHQAPLHAFLDPRNAGGSPGDSEGDPYRAVRDHGRHDRRQRSRPSHDVSGHQERDAGVGRPGSDRRGGRTPDGLRSAVDSLHRAGAPGRPRRRGPARDRNRRGPGSRRRELAVLGRQEPGAHRRRRPDLVRSAEAVSAAVLPYAAGQRIHPGQRGLPRHVPLAVRGPPRLSPVVRNHGLGPAVLALRGAGTVR